MIRYVLASLALALSGCAHYTTPGGGAPLVAIDDDNIAGAFAREPAARFPAHIIVARIQEPGYADFGGAGRNLGAYSVVSVRDLESGSGAASFEDIASIADVAPLPTLLLPATASSIGDLRRPAAELRADLLLVYTVDTRFTIDGSNIGPLSVVSLGMLRDRHATVTATVAGVLVDVRTGFVYGAIEASAIEDQHASAWTSSTKTDAARVRAEKTAYVAFTEEFRLFWDELVDDYSRPHAEGVPYSMYD